MVISGCGLVLVTTGNGSAVMGGLIVDLADGSIKRGGSVAGIGTASAGGCGGSLFSNHFLPARMSLAGLLSP